MSLEKIGEEELCLAVAGMDYPPPETPKEPMEFLARSWSISALEVSKALAPLMKHQQQLLQSQDPNQQCISNAEKEAQECPHFSTGSSQTSPHLVSMDTNISNSHLGTSRKQSKGKSVGRWLKDKKGKKKEEQRAHNAQLHAAVSVGGVAAAVAAIAAANATAYNNYNKYHNENENENKNEEELSNKSMAMASAAALVAGHCVEMAMCMGAERHKIASLLNSAVNVKTPGDIITLTAGAATALRGAATLQARVVKEAGANGAVIPFEKPTYNPRVTPGFSGELGELEICSQDIHVLARGCELLKRTRKGHLHWKTVSVYIKNNEVVVKLKSKHMGGRFTKKKKSIVLGVFKDLPAWPGRETSGGEEERCYFNLDTESGVIQFECKNKRVYEIWTQGVERLLSLAGHKKSTG